MPRPRRRPPPSIDRGRLSGRAIVGGLATLGVALLLILPWGWSKLRSPSHGPLILISIDTLRADHLPTYGYGAVRTPAIDALAAGGVVFESAYAHAPQTLPSHVSILSGRLPFEHGVRDNVGF